MCVWDYPLKAFIDYIRLDSLVSLYTKRLSTDLIITKWDFVYVALKDVW